MNQSSYIAAALIAGFVLYVAAQDRLKVYAAVLWGNTKATLPSSQYVSPGAPVAGPGGASSGGALGGLLPDLGGSGGGGFGGFIEQAAPLLLEGA